VLVQRRGNGHFRQKRLAAELIRALKGCGGKIEQRWYHPFFFTKKKSALKKADTGATVFEEQEIRELWEWINSE